MGDQARILHWNVHSWRDASGQASLDEVIAQITSLDADVVSLVEVNEPWAAPAALPELASKAGYSWIFIPSVELGRDTPTRGYGNALLTRLPVLAVQQWQLTWPPALYDGTEPSETRSMVLARLKLPSASLWAGSTHLPSTSKRSRAAALRRLAAVTRGLEPPWLICGDFNIAARRWIQAAQPVVLAPDPPQPTFPARHPRRSIDYCIASPDMSLDARALRAPGSDHLPVIVQCSVPGRHQSARS
jgi:endonuclease/exonuclease/phosphatase family metal-dependent hydrolase